VVEWQVNRRLEEKILEKLVNSPFSHLTRLPDRAYFIELSRPESFKLHSIYLCTILWFIPRLSQ